MRLKLVFHITTLICVGVRFGASENQLSDTVNSLSRVARLTNGIALQNELFTSPNKFQLVVGELLDVGSAEVFTNLAKFDVDSMSKQLETFTSDVQKLPTSTVKNMKGVGSGLAKLNGLAEKVPEGNDGLSLNVTEVENKWAEAKKKTVMEVFWHETLSPIADGLEYIFKATTTKKAKEILKNEEVMKDVSSKIDTFLNIFGAIVDKSQVDELWPLIDSENQWDALQKMSELLEQYTTDIAVFQSLSASMNSLTTDLNNLGPVLKSSQKQAIGSAMLNMSQEVVEVLKTRSTRDLTAGLPKGIADLDLIFEDLKDRWLRDSIGDGKNLEKMANGLTSLKNWKDTLKPLDSSWKLLKNDSEAQQGSEGTAVWMKEIEDAGKKLIGKETVVQKIGGVSRCLKNLQQVAQPIDLQKVKGLVDKLKEFDANVRKLQEVIGKIVNSPVLQSTNSLTEIKVIYASITSSGDTDLVNAAIEKIQKIKDFKKTVEFVHGSVDELRKLPLKKMYDFLIGANEWSLLAGLKQAVTSTNLLTALQCLSKEQFQSSDTEAFVKFEVSVRAMSSKDVDAAKKFLKVMADVLGAMKTVKAPVRRRRRGVSELQKLEHSQKVANDLGQGVEVLKQLGKVLEKQNLVTSLTKFDDSVNKALETAIPSWTSDNRAQIQKLVEDVNALNNFTASNSKKDLKSVWKVFDEAQKVTGVAIEVDQVLKSLPSNSPILKPAIDKFNQAAELRLDYANSQRLHLKAAALTLNQLQTFFDSFFGISRATSQSQLVPVSPNTSTADNSTVILAVGIGGGLLLAGLAIGFGGYFGRDYYQQQKRWKDRERYWIYSALLEVLDGTSIQTSLVLALREERLNCVKKLLKNGCFVTIYDGDRNTPLHVAVQTFNPQAVKLLIRYGADRSAGNLERETAEQSLKRMIEEGKSGKDEQCKENMSKLVEIQEIFKKFQGKVFKPRIPALFPADRFRVYAGKDSKKFAEFKKMYPKNIESNGKISHIAVDTDKDGVYDFDALKPSENPSQDISTFLDHITSTTILVRSEWLDECMKSKKNFYKDYEFRVTKVKFKGQLFETVDEWKRSARLRRIPFLEGVKFQYFTQFDQFSCNIKPIVNVHGAETFESVVGDFPPNPPPFHHPSLKPRFIVHSDESKEYLLKQGPLSDAKIEDYTVQSLSEFCKFMLEFKSSSQVKADTASTATSTGEKSKLSDANKTV